MFPLVCLSTALILKTQHFTTGYDLGVDYDDKDSDLRLHEGIDEDFNSSAASPYVPQTVTTTTTTNGGSSQALKVVEPVPGNKNTMTSDLLLPGVDMNNSSYHIDHPTEPDLTVASVEDQTALFEDILHPEMMEALEQLQQLDFEEGELVKQIRRAVGKPKTVRKDFLDALCMELDMRRKEKAKTMETFRRVEEERSENTQLLVKEMRKIRTQNVQLLNTLESRNRRQEGNFIGDEMDMYDWVGTYRGPGGSCGCERGRERWGGGEGVRVRR